MLALSTAAAPDLSLEVLDAAVRARGLDGEELVLHAGQDPERLAAFARSVKARVAALRVEMIDEDEAPALARASGVLGVPVSVPPRAIEPTRLGALARLFARAGGRLLVSHRSELDDAIATLATVRAIDEPTALGLAWELEPALGALNSASAILLATRERLGLVRLHGGGPEQRDQDGRGVGSLIGELALSGFTGPIVLCPSAPERVARWTTWLSSRGSSGCGHAASSREIVLDVRDVEPRDRLETILGAYRMLVPGATLDLTVDHDPSCMYYTLEATEPPRSFTFEIVENGPEVWRAQVTKR